MINDKRLINNQGIKFTEHWKYCYQSQNIIKYLKLPLSILCRD